MNLYRAGDIMIPLNKYPHIPHWFTMRQALAEMEHTELEIGGRGSLPRVVLVFDEEYALLGIVRRRIVRIHLVDPNVGRDRDSCRLNRERIIGLVRIIAGDADRGCLTANGTRSKRDVKGCRTARLERSDGWL